MPPRTSSPVTRPGGLAALRRIGAVSDLLFLYECETREISQLRTVADRLGLTVQAASHTYRGLVRRGLAEVRDGRYRPTVAGVDWIHSALGGVRDDLADRLARLRIVRTTRAVAAASFPAGRRVSLEIVDGRLTALPGSHGASTGSTQASARKGELVEVGELSGIVPLRPGRLTIVVVPRAGPRSARVLGELSRHVRAGRAGLVATVGLEATHLAERAAPRRPIVRFGVAAAVEEATRLGIDCTVVLAETDLPRLFERFEGVEPPATEILTLTPGGGRARRERRARGR